VRPGVVVHVAPGRYAGPLTIARSGTARRPVRFVSDRRWRARISAPRRDLLSVVEIHGDYVNIAGFDVTGGGAVGIEVEGSENVVAGNRVHDVAGPCVAGAGIVVGSGNDGYRQHDVLVTGNVVERIGTGPRDGSCRLLHGIYAAVPRVAVVNNIVQGAVGDGITSWHAARGLTITNNLSMMNGGAGILVGSGDAGASRIGHIRTLVSNNIVYRNALYGITETSDGRHPVGPGNQYVHNLAFANRGGDRSSESGVGGLSSGEIVASNLNADPALTGSLHRPGAGSPAVDAGTCAGAPRRDFEGAARAQGRAVDIGPHERRSSPGRCDR
jgi:Right handed beta helix region